MVSALKVPVNSSARRAAADAQCGLLVEGDLVLGAWGSGRGVVGESGIVCSRVWWC